MLLLEYSNSIIDVHAARFLCVCYVQFCFSNYLLHVHSRRVNEWASALVCCFFLSIFICSMSIFVADQLFRLPEGSAWMVYVLKTAYCPNELYSDIGHCVSCSKVINLGVFSSPRSHPSLQPSKKYRRKIMWQSVDLCTILISVCILNGVSCLLATRAQHNRKRKTLHATRHCSQTTMHVMQSAVHSYDYVQVIGSWFMHVVCLHGWYAFSRQLLWRNTQFETFGLQMH